MLTGCAFCFWSDRDLRGACSSGPIDPMPSDASNADLSNGLEANSVDVGERMPKLSAGSASSAGLMGVMANSAERGEDTAGSWVGGLLRNGSGFGNDNRSAGFDSASTIFNTGTTWPEGSTYAVAGLTETEGRPCRLSVDGQGTPDGAEDGPGDRADRPSAALLSLVGALAADNGISRVDAGEAMLENGPFHSLKAELGSIGLRPLLPDRRPPRARLDLNSCSCMMRFMLGPIHLLRFLTASYASWTLSDGSL